MMTFETRTAQVKSVNNLLKPIAKKWSRNLETAHKLCAFLTWFQPTGSIRESVSNYIDRLFAEADELYELKVKLERKVERLYALPYQSTFKFSDGDTETFTHSGFLPNGDKSSEDEAIALKMLDEYYAKESA